MGRNDLLRQRKERDEAQKELDQKYKNPSSVKYDLCDEYGNNHGNAEYFPQTDQLQIFTKSRVSIEGALLKSLRDVLNKLLDE